MRVSNFLEYTEHHRFFVYRDFALSALERKLLVSLYQPMIGALSASLYQLIYQTKPDEETGYSELLSQRGLFLGVGAEMNASGRKQLVEATSRLEAVGLMQTFRHDNPVSDETVYEYSLLPPLAAKEFFSNLHLTLLLTDKIGKPGVLELRRRWTSESPPELARFVNREEVTVPFYELFRISSAGVDPDLEPGYRESAPARESKVAERIRHSDILLRFPRSSDNRKHVERLNRAPESMAKLNYLAYKFDLEVPEICRLLHEDGIFREDGTLEWEELHRRANSVYRQDRKRDEERERYMARGEGRPGEERSRESASAYRDAELLDVPERFLADTSRETYNDMLLREPYTRILERYFPGAVPDSFVRVFEKIDLNYKLPEPVINVLIHYVLGMNHAQRLTGSFIDSIASNMLAKSIDHFSKAVAYVREQEKLNAMLERKRRGETEPRTGKGGERGSSSRGRTASRKPDMPVVKDQDPAQPMTEEEREKLRELARKLKGDG
jgi:replication initiation and membrane attachment protein